MTRRVRLVAATLGLVLVAACGDPVSFGDPLTDEEAASISAMLGGAAANGFNQGFQSPAAAAPYTAPEDVIQFSQAVSYSGLCAGGGSVNIQGKASGSIDTATESGTLSLDVQASASQCQAVHNTVTFTVDANLSLSGDFEFANGVPVGNNEFTYKGQFEWTSDDARSGGCKIDVRLTITPTGAGVVNGTVCGRTMQPIA